MDENDDWCASCLQPGDLLCCDTCPKSFHYLCAEPPLDAIPEGDWRCTECRTRVRRSLAVNLHGATSGPDAGAPNCLA